jgi:hypothetical protein
MNDTLQGVTPIPQYIQKNRVGLPGCAKNANLSMLMLIMIYIYVFCYNKNKLLIIF